MAPKKKYLPDKSRQIISDILLNLIFILIFFGIGFLAAGGIIGLEPGETHLFSYFGGAAAASLIVPGRLCFGKRPLLNKILICVVWMFSVIGAGILLHLLGFS